MSGIQNCGVEPLHYVRGCELRIGDKVSVWWMPKGSRVLGVRDYDNAFSREMWPEGARILNFEAPQNRIHQSAEMTVPNADHYAIMP